MQYFKSTQLVFIVAFFFTLSSFVNESVKPIKFTIKKGVFKVDKVIINSDWSIEVIKTRLGTPEKIKKGYNTTYTYTDLGIVLFEGKESNLNEIQIYYSLINRSEIAPYAPFRGSFKIDKLNIDVYLSKDLLFEKLADWQPQKSYSDHIFRVEKDGIYIYFEFSPDDLNLNKMSLGKKI